MPDCAPGGRSHQGGLGEVWEMDWWGGRGCFWVKAVRLGVFHGTVGCRPTGLMMGAGKVEDWQEGGVEGWVSWVGRGWVGLGQV
jgi:hypothetical protein